MRHPPSSGGGVGAEGSARYSDQVVELLELLVRAAVVSGHESGGYRPRRANPVMTALQGVIRDTTEHMAPRWATTEAMALGRPLLTGSIRRLAGRGLNLDHMVPVVVLAER